MDSGGASMSSPTRRTLLLLFPGNPYIYALYDQLLSMLERQGQQLGITAKLVQYADVPVEKLHDHRAAFQHIADDARMQVQALDRQWRSQGPPQAQQRLVLVGHSFGSYIANLVVRDVRPDACIFVFPFLAKPTFSGRVILHVADLCYRKTGLGDWLHPRTTALFNTIMRRLNSESKQSILATPQALQAIFRVAACEGPEIAAKPDLSHVPYLANRKAYLLYTEGDQWCPRWVWDAWPEDRRVDLSHVPHAFPCQDKDDEQVALALLRVVEQLHANAQLTENGDCHPLPDPHPDPTLARARL